MLGKNFGRRCAFRDDNLNTYWYHWAEKVSVFYWSVAYPDRLCPVVLYPESMNSHFVSTDVQAIVTVLGPYYEYFNQGIELFLL